MKRLVVLVLLVSLGACSRSTAAPSPTVGATRLSPTATASSRPLPPPATPGAVNPAVTQANVGTTICKAGWTATVRPPVNYTNALKRQQLAAAGVPAIDAKLYEEDHRVPLEVGGNPTDPKNLWPELWAGPYGAHAKDALENKIHAEVCTGKLTLSQGQAVFLGAYWSSL